MPHVLKNRTPSTYIIKLFEDADKFSIVDSNNKMYYYRYLPMGYKTIKVNIPDPGDYYFSNDATVTRKPLEIGREVYDIKMPPKERNRVKDWFVTYDENETSSPAIIYTQTGHIIIGRSFRSLPIPMKIFILLHEIEHFKYSTEKYCDLGAFREFVLMGYNPSTAMYCLTDYLKSNPQNDERINYLYQKMIDAEIIK